MATKYVTLKDSNGDTLYPQISSATITDGTITTNKIADNAITSSKINYSTLGSLNLNYYDSNTKTITGPDYTPLGSGTITTHGGRLLFNGFTVGTLSGSIVYLRINIDGNDYRVSQSNITTSNFTLPGSMVISGLSAGSHNVSFGVQVQQSTRNYVISSYTWISATFVEL